MNTLTREQLMSALEYCPETGVFRRRVRSANMPAGSVAGHRKTNGYVEISLFNRVYYAHRLAFLYMTGEFPVNHADHIDGDRSNNKWGNLRQATHRENLCNRGAAKNNKTGVKGVYWESRGNRYVSFISGGGGKRRYLGTFPDVETAAEAYMSAARSLHGEFARGGL
jgi:hypothetical protein